MAKKIKKSDLGKGIGALLSSFENSPPSTPPPKEVVKELSNTIAPIDIVSIEVNPFQPRNVFEEQPLKELSESIKVHGLIQPITVRQMGDGKFQLISGERRLRACKLAGLKQIPAYVRIANDQEMLEMALVENIQREQLNPIEVALTYQRLIDECKIRQEDLGDRVGKSRVLINRVLGLLKLPPDIQNALKEKKISRGHAMTLTSIDNLELQLILLQRIQSEALSVRKLEDIIRSYKNPQSSTPAIPKQLPLEYQKVQENLGQHLGAKVQIKLKKKGKGEIVIPFGSVKDLNRLLDIIEE